ncbi:MAG: type II toxin-antitoxin system YafQ family toxin, partial [Rhodospirillales bacterium]|nr:type II toxin-antitoxin system YafQ family toxin [Rhodospirillales bacterium]
EILLADGDMPSSLRDHGLSGKWANHRECHLRPDLLLIYAKPSADVLRLVRLGSHSDLFG